MFFKAPRGYQGAPKTPFGEVPGLSGGPGAGGLLGGPGPLGTPGGTPGHLGGGLGSLWGGSRVRRGGFGELREVRRALRSSPGLPQGIPGRPKCHPRLPLSWKYNKNLRFLYVFQSAQGVPRRPQNTLWRGPGALWSAPRLIWYTSRGSFERPERLWSVPSAPYKHFWGDF